MNNQIQTSLCIDVAYNEDDIIVVEAGIAGLRVVKYYLGSVGAVHYA
jgi:hypothetical protein